LARVTGLTTRSSLEADPSISLKDLEEFSICRRSLNVVWHPYALLFEFRHVKGSFGKGWVPIILMNGENGWSTMPANKYVLHTAS
jgi:hypothetical protein